MDLSINGYWMQDFPIACDSMASPRRKSLKYPKSFLRKVLLHGIEQSHIWFCEKGILKLFENKTRKFRKDMGNTHCL